VEDTLNGQQASGCTSPLCAGSRRFGGVERVCCQIGLKFWTKQASTALPIWLISY